MRELRLRNSMKAYIVRDQAILLVECVDEDGVWYILPGGGMQPGETMIEALQRECLEEIGAEVEVGSLIAIREYIGTNHEFANFSPSDHQIEFMFACRVPEGYRPVCGGTVDARQTSVVWMPLEQLDSIRLYPRALRAFFARPGEMNGCVYFGDVN